MDIKQEICSWIGKPWIHGQAHKEAGADCIQFIVAVYKQIGMLPKDFKTINYDRDWAVHNTFSILKKGVSEHTDLVYNSNEEFLNNKEKLQVGDIILMISGKTAGHAGFYIGDGDIVHAHIRHGIIRENIERYYTKIESVWRIKCL